MNLVTNAIEQYIQSINFKKNDWSIKDIKNNVSKMLGENVTIDVKYSKEYRIDEVNKKAVKLDKLEELIIYYYDDVNKKINSLKYFID